MTAEIGAWTTFYALVGGAAATLTGLIFVAVTLHNRSIMGNELHRERAGSSIALLATQLFVALAVLAPAQQAWLPGAEVDVIAAFWLYRTIWAVRDLGPAMRRVDRGQFRWQVEWVVLIAWAVVLATGSVALTVGSAIGLPLLGLAMVGMFGFAIWNAWVLISEVSE